jgi:hypothetical protein
MRFKYVMPWKDLLFRMCRSESSIRGFNMFFSLGVINAIMYVKGEYYDPVYTVPKKKKEAEELEALDNKAKEVLFYNKFGAPTRPLRSLDDLMTFLAGSKTFDDLADFLSYNTAMDINTDMQNGLDSWMSPVDKDMVNQYRIHVKNAHH